jgi:hypothetical protein
MNTKTNTHLLVAALLIIGLAALLAGCAGSRSVTFDDDTGRATPAGVYSPAPIPPRPASQAKIPVGIMIGISKEEIERYPQLKENNIGLGLQYVVRETLSNSDWFTLCAVDEEMIVAFEKLKDYYWHGEVPEGRQAAESQKPEYILMVGLSRVDLIGKERVIGSRRTFQGDCAVKVNFECIPLLSDYPTIKFSVPGQGAVPVRESDSVFAGGSETRSGAFGQATERAVRNAVPVLITKF